jgi:hypothetical protein
MLSTTPAVSIQAGASWNLGRRPAPLTAAAPSLLDERRPSDERYFVARTLFDNRRS